MQTDHCGNFLLPATRSFWQPGFVWNNLVVIERWKTCLVSGGDEVQLSRQLKWAAFQGFGGYRLMAFLVMPASLGVDIAETITTTR